MKRTLAMMRRIVKSTYEDESGLCKVTGALVVLMIVAACFCFFVSPPAQYANMSSAQEFQQIDRIYTDQAQACRDAGGAWMVGFADAYCTVAYTPPDTSWYIVPVDNPAYGVWDAINLLSVTVLLAGACGLLVLGGELLFVAYDAMRQAFDEARRAPAV